VAAGLLQWGRGGREGGGLVKNKKEMDFLIENGKMAAALLCGAFSRRGRAIGQSRSMGARGPVESSKWDHLSVCHVLVSLPVERTGSGRVVVFELLQSQFIAGPLLPGLVCLRWQSFESLHF